MDAFKASEIERMRLGGNENWRKFFDEHGDTQLTGISWDDATIAERYSGEVGDEYKERLSCKVEGKEYTPGTKSSSQASAAAPATSSVKQTPRSATPRSGPGSQGQSRNQSPGQGKVKVDDKYFAKLGADNASRPDGLPPSQGGKYAGFGNMPEPVKSSQPVLPNFDDVQKDPLAALTKGFGWFTSTVTKTAKTVNDGYIQPTASKLAEGDFAKQAQLTAAQFARQAQLASKNAQEGFNRFVEGQDGARREAPIDESKKDFWDSFSNLADQQKQNQVNNSIGTSAMGMGKSKSSSSATGQPKKSEDWDDW